jgi:hypothetical protein
MSRRIAAAALVLSLLPAAAQAFCGGWDQPVALGFGGQDWGSKWPVLGLILVGVSLFSTFIIRRVSRLRAGDGDIADALPQD